jgi:2-polyprenyl-6-hydroxyphenyl methylase/3-demethylubiquinone-9 3-methyltransferase
MTSALEHFESTAGAYEAHAESRPEFEERFRVWDRAIDRALPAGSAGATAIDLGCGPGHLTQRLVSRGLHTIAIDGSEAMLARTRERLEREGLPGADVRPYVLPLPVPAVDDLAGTAQLIVMSSVIEYVDDDHELLRQCRQLLTPGGHLLASFPNRRSLYWTAQRALKATPLFAGSASRHQRHQYDPAWVRQMGRNVGLELCDITFFAVPLQRFTHAFVTRRRPRLATLFLADLRR